MPDAWMIFSRALSKHAGFPVLVEPVTDFLTSSTYRCRPHEVWRDGCWVRRGALNSPPVFGEGRLLLFFGRRFFAHGFRLLFLDFLAHHRRFAGSELLGCLIIQFRSRGSAPQVALWKFRVYLDWTATWDIFRSMPSGNGLSPVLTAVPNFSISHDETFSLVAASLVTCNLSA